MSRSTFSDAPAAEEGRTPEGGRAAEGGLAGEGGLAVTGAAARPSLGSWLASSWLSVLVALTGAMMLLALGLALVWAPTEASMGNVQRIFYFHVASAWIALGPAFTLVFICSILYLAKARAVYDRIAISSAEVGMVFTTVTLVTGPLWAKPVWGVYWVWEPRLTTTLVLWFMYLAYLLLRQVAGPGARGARLAAVFGIIAWVDVPVVFLSIWWWRSVHPRIITAQGLALDRSMTVALMLSLAAFTLLYVSLLLVRLRLEGMRADVRALRFRVRPWRGGS